MPRNLDYDSADFESARLHERFPQWVLGYRLWAEYAKSLESPDAFDRFRQMIAIERLELRRGGKLPGGITRVFVSHKKENRDEALRVAWLANQAGHHFWLDVLDPTLTGTPLNPIQIAGTIEMALLNCTHVIALLTPKSVPSRWIPYEYGRVKEPTPYTLNAASWLHQVSNIPEYLELGILCQTENHITRWLVGPGPGNAPSPWIPPEPPTLPT
jgi:hypothetical protein